MSKIDFFTVPKFFVGDSFSFRKIFSSKNFMDRKGISRFSLETFLSDSPEKFPSVTLLIERYSGLKKLHKMVYHDFVENWFSQSTEKHRMGTLLFSENFLYGKSSWIGGGYHDFLSKLFCLTVPKELLGGPFFSENFWIKELHKVVHHNFVEKWFSHSTEKFRSGTLRFSEFFLSKKFMDRKGISRFSLENFLSDSPEKIPSVTLLIEKFSGLKKLHKMVYHNFVENWFSQSTEKRRRGTLLFSENFLCRKSFWIGGGYHDFLSKLFYLTVPKELLGGPFFSENFCNKESA